MYKSLLDYWKKETETMYNSPLEIINSFTNDMARKIATETDNLVMEAVYNVGVNVDKAELIKALEYDRDQYEKGYRDGLAEALEVFETWLANEYFTFERIKTIPELLSYLYKERTGKEEGGDK